MKTETEIRARVEELEETMQYATLYAVRNAPAEAMRDVLLWALGEKGANA